MGPKPRKTWGYAVLGGMLGLLGPGRVQAVQDPGPLITDRPDQTESAAVVPRGLVQIEGGWGYARDVEAGVEVQAHTLPQMLLRIGIVQGLEGRVGFAGWTRTEVETVSGASTASGVGDIDLGFKYRLAHARGARPDIAFIGTVTLPTGEADFGSERADPSFRLAFANELGERVGLGYNVGAAWTSVPGASGGTETNVDAVYTVAFGFSLTDQVGAFAESFGTFALSDGSSSAHSLDGGLTLLVSDNLQLDLSGGVGLNDAAADWFVGAGISARLPK